MSDQPKPQKLELISDEVLSVIWDDGHQSVYFAKDLRKKCPCAQCEQEKKKACTEQSRSEKGKKSSLPVISVSLKNVQIKGWQRIGRYAIKFFFSGGHRTGIYTYEYLRSICQCDECDMEGTVRIQGPLITGG